MSITQNGRIRCDDCGLFCAWDDFDDYTPFGCDDPENPEPYDPSHLCGRCSEKKYLKLLQAFKEGRRWGDWQKSKAEVRAANDAGLEWVGSTGYVDTRTYAEVRYQYIVAAEKSFYEPYVEFLSKPENRAKFEAARKAYWENMHTP